MPVCLSDPVVLIIATKAVKFRNTIPNVVIKKCLFVFLNLVLSDFTSVALKIPTKYFG